MKFEPMKVITLEYLENYNLPRFLFLIIIEDVSEIYKCYVMLKT